VLYRPCRAGQCDPTLSERSIGGSTDFLRSSSRHSWAQVKETGAHGSALPA
jgi:hypothetical protein